MNAATTTFYFCSAIAFMASTVLQAADDIVLRTSLTPESPILVGQRVILSIDVLGKDGWAKLERVPRIEVDGTVVYVPPETGSRMNETIEGESYSGTRSEIWLYPQRAGQIEIPTNEWPAVNQVFGAKTGSAKKTLVSSPLSFTATAAPGGGRATVAQSLTATQSWTDHTKVLKIGDGITRQIRRTASGIPSLLIKPIEFPEQSGLRILVDEPQSSNKINRGELTAQRTDQATYIFQQAGEIVLPDLDITWIDTKTGSLKSETLVGLRLKVAEAETTAGDPLVSSTDALTSSWLRWFVGPGVVCCALVLTFAFIWRRKHASVGEFIGSIQASEQASFRRFRQAASRGRPVETLRQLYAWWSTFDQTEVGIREWLKQSGSQSSVELLNDLERSVAQSAPQSAKRLVQDVARARHATLAARRLRAKPVPLPPLR